MDYYELFGVDRPEGEEPEAGVEEQDVAEPAAEMPEAGEEEQDVADPDTVDDGAEQGEPEGKPEQSVEQRREYAAARRRAEQQAAIDAAVREERARNNAEWDRYIADMGIKDPYHDNRPVTNRAEFEEYERERTRRAMDRDLKAGRVTVENFEEQVQQEAVREAQRQAAAAAEAARTRAAGHAEVDRQFAELKAFDPTVQTMEQLMTGERAEEFRNNLVATKDMVKAYKLTYFDVLQSREREIVGRAAAGRGAGKDHLRSSQGRSAGASTLTNARIAEYREFMPDASLEDIRKFEEKFQKKGK